MHYLKIPHPYVTSLALLTTTRAGNIPLTTQAIRSEFHNVAMGQLMILIKHIYINVTVDICYYPIEGCCCYAVKGVE